MTDITQEHIKNLQDQSYEKRNIRRKSRNRPQGI